MKLLLHIAIVMLLNLFTSQLLISQERENNISSHLQNDQCDNPVQLIVNGKCKVNNFLFEKTTNSVAEDQERSDVWYSFIAPLSGHVSIILNTELAENLIVYSGKCSELIEVNSLPNGQQTEVKDLIPGNKYLLKINASKNSLLSESCITIKEVIPVLPANQNCINAKTVTIGDICTPGNNQYNKFSGPKPSCVPYAEANVWYSVLAPESGTIKLNSGADFYHVLAVYSGRCDSLVEIFCSKNPQKCNGYLEVRNLFPGQQYYVQIASAQGPFGYNFGNYCLEILDGNAADTYIPIKVNAGITCVGEGLGHVNYTVNGGKGNYTIEGTSVDDILHTGQVYEIVVKDEWGCEVSFFDKVECGIFDCQLNASTYSTDVTCQGEYNGTAGIKVTNETGTVSYQWSNGESSQEIKSLCAGTYTVTVTDSKSCQLSTSVKVNEPNNLSVTIDEIIPESSFNSNGAITITTKGGTPPYSYNWTKNSIPISNNKNLNCAISGRYDLIVYDLNACNFAIRDLEISNMKSNSPLSVFDWNVYPNPSDKEISVRIPLSIEENITLSLLDPKGKIMKNFQFRSNDLEFKLPVQDIPTGLYLLQFKTTNIADQRKVIIQH